MLHDFLTFFETIPSSWRSIVLVSGLLVFWILEGAIPLFSASYRRYRHAGLNLVFTLTTLVVNLGLAFLIVIAADWTTSAEFGLLYVVSLPLWAQVLGGILLLDLIGAWFVHWIQHKVRWMWKFHIIHHTDTHVDVTTALRHHPGESVFRALFTVFGVLAAGVPIGVVFLYQTLSALFSQFNHANIVLPGWVERSLSWFIVTPDMHKVHHHWVQPLTDTNYGNIFSIWDRMFGTYDPTDAKEVTYGIDTHMEKEEHDDVGNLLKIPFQPYRAPSGSKFSDGTGPGLTLVFLMLLSGCVGPSTLSSLPISRPIEVDSDVVEWIDNLTEIADTRLRVGFQHDEDYLYLAVVSTQRATVQQIAADGLTIWFDVSGGENKGLGLGYPIGIRALDAARPMPGGRGPGSEQDRFARLRQVAGEIDVFYEEDKPIRRLVAADPGLLADMAFEFGAFTMELRIPRRMLSPDGFHVDVTDASMLSIGFETFAERPTDEPSGRDEDGARGSTGGFGAVGRDFGGRGAGPSPLFSGALDEWIRITVP